MQRLFKKPVIILALFLIISSNYILAQQSDIPVIIEAESGEAGSHFTQTQEDDITFITTTVDFTGQSSPEDASRIVSLPVTFQDTGYYNLFARIRVGPGNYTDDSFFAGIGFGEKNQSSASDWVFINGLASAGFYSSLEFVEEAGTAGSEVWKWINITKNYFPGSNPEESFYVAEGELTKTFQFASREDGLDFDKFAFGKANLYFTVNSLDNGLAGQTTMVVDSSNYYKGPPLAKGASKFLGNSDDNADNSYLNYWNQITAGNAGKWGSVAYTSDSLNWDWETLDRIYNFAKKNNILFKNHCLIWGSQQPSWISDLDTAKQKKYIETWIRMVGERYPDMDMVDVVNEPLENHNPPDGIDERANYKEALGGDGKTGWDWVIKSFELAREYMPGVELILNDYGIINDNNATTTYLEIINLLKDRGLIDAIGVQGHRFALERATNSTLKYNLDRLAATGLPVYISELDLGNLSNEGTPDDNEQLELYKRIFPLLWEHSGVKGITLWGYLEGEMWQSTCYLVLKNGTWRPAMEWMADYIQDYISGSNGIIGESSAISLSQNYPNPFDESTLIRFYIPESLDVSLKIYDISGREITTLVNDNLNKGTYNIPWDGSYPNGVLMQSGTYIYRLVAGNTVKTGKMLLNR